MKIKKTVKIELELNEIESIAVLNILNVPDSYVSEYALSTEKLINEYGFNPKSIKKYQRELSSIAYKLWRDFSDAMKGVE